jgi:hypothetical protein
MRPWKKVIIVLSALAVLGIACVISWTYGFRDGMRAGGIGSSTAELMAADRHMADQLANANCDGTRQAIVDYLETIEKNKGVKNGIITETSYQGDKMLGHMRLALIEKKHGNRTEEALHMAIAREACIARKWGDCSDEKLMMYVSRFEEKNPMVCLNNEKKEHAQPSR